MSSLYRTRGRPPLQPGQTGNYTRHKHVKYGRPLHPDNKPAAEHPTVADIMWAAGIYEGEGNVHTQTIYQFTVAIGQKDPWVLQRLQSLFGGLIADRRICWIWTCTGERARGFTMTIYKFLSPRRKLEILVALKVTNPRFREKITHVTRQES